MEGLRESILNNYELIGTLLVPVLIAIFSSPILIALGKRFSSWVEMKRRYPDLAAIFLSNGQTYFGKITKLTSTDLLLENIYYLNKSDDKPIKGRSEQDLTLVKLGDELHAPEDFMLINRQHIVFIEHLKDEGKVAKAVQKHADLKDRRGS